jgi:hypothetical protein
MHMHMILIDPDLRELPVRKYFRTSCILTRKYLATPSTRILRRYLVTHTRWYCVF